MIIYSIWLDLPEPVKNKYSLTIKDLAEKYDGPIFEPHLTLIGGIVSRESTLVRQISKLLSNVKSIKVIITNISFGTTYFQCVFMNIKKSHELMDLYRKTKQLLNLVTPFYKPHISLLYGNHTTNVRRKITEKIKNEIVTIYVKKVIIVKSTKNMNVWKHVEEISL